ncbi:hypothetical protein FRC17_006081 [Serendipita sp. 399]|nr:hypothetical protein FRC17_006081 [Serendipita sp. 399]
MANSFPFHRCHLYIITPIFQALVDDEEASFMDNNLVAERRSNHPQVLRNLQLVCRSWFNVVSNTPSLWSMVVLDLFRGKDELTAHIAKVRRHAPIQPLAVYILNCHMPWNCGASSSTPHPSPAVCPSSHGGISAYLNSIREVRSLHVLRLDRSRGAFVIHRGLPSTFFHTTREFDVDTSAVTRSGKYALMKQVGAMPYLTTLKIKGIEQCHVTFNTRRPGLASLEVLHVESHQLPSVTSQTLPNLLSNCPNLVKLYYNIAQYAVPAYQFRPFKLDRLQTVHTTAIGSLSSSILRTDRISTPNLELLTYDQPAGAMTPQLDEFVRAHPGMRAVCTVVVEEPPKPVPFSSLAPVPALIPAPEPVDATAPVVLSPSDAIRVLGGEPASVPLGGIDIDIELTPVSEPAVAGGSTRLPSTSGPSKPPVAPFIFFRNLFMDLRRSLGRVARL